jgi:HK97 family phage prohead protease
MRSRQAEYIVREAPVLEVDERQRTALVRISAECRDEYDSVILQRGLRYGQDLPVLVGHDRNELPVARTSRIWLGQENGVPVTYALLSFPPSGQNYRSDETYSAVKNGLAKSTSIGFFVDKVSERPDGLTQVDEARLAEVSFVSVGANPMAQVLQVTQPETLVTRQPPPQPGWPAASRELTTRPAESTVHVIHAPHVLERKTDLRQISFFDFAALAVGLDVESKRDLGPAKEWTQFLDQAHGGPPSRGVRVPLGLMYHRQTPERDKELHRRQGEALMTETLMRSMLADFAAALRLEAYFGALGVPTPMASELNFIVPSVATRPLRSQWIGKDAPATPGPIPTFTAVAASPHTLSTLVVIPRSMLLYTGGLAEQTIREEVSAAHLAEMQRTYLFGNGQAAPDTIEGLLALVPVSVFPGAPLTFERADLWRFVDAIENAPLGQNADTKRRLRWFFPNRFQRQMAQTRLFPEADARSDLTVLAPFYASTGVGELEGYPFAVSNYLRSNLGTAPDNRNCDLMFGDFSQSWWISWQSAVVMTNPYSSEPTGFRAGGIELLILSDHDMRTRDVAGRITRTERALHDVSPPPPP